MQLSYNVYESLDKDIDEKLLYVPDNSASLLMVYKQNNSTHYSLNYKLTGNRILQYASSFAEQVDDEYISTIGYPEPGRSLNFTLEYKI